MFIEILRIRHGIDDMHRRMRISVLGKPSCIELDQSSSQLSAELQHMYSLPGSISVYRFCTVLPNSLSNFFQVFCSLCGQRTFHVRADAEGTDDMFCCSFDVRRASA